MINAFLLCSGFVYVSAHGLRRVILMHGKCERLTSGKCRCSLFPRSDLAFGETKSFKKKIEHNYVKQFAQKNDLELDAT